MLTVDRGPTGVVDPNVDRRRRPSTLDKLRQRVWATRTMLLMRLGRRS